MSKSTIQIFNLQFPPHIEELRIGDYYFKRVENYPDAFQGMMHLVNSSGGEFATKIKTGSHQITSTAVIPDKEERSVLPWSNKNCTQLDDILFFLTLFTGKNVFKKDATDEEGEVIIADHRQHAYGGQLVLSLCQEWMYKNKRTGEIRPADGMDKGHSWVSVNVGFEKGVNRVLENTSNAEWLKAYEGGYFLFLYRSAIQRQIIETSFISCWTIWEHIFAIRNRNWLDDKTIEQISGDKKIAFILREYFLKDIDEDARKSITRLNKTRNRLVHFGKKTEQIGYQDMEMFIRLTEQLIAIVLGLSPSNLFNSFEALDRFLAPQSKNG